MKSQALHADTVRTAAKPLSSSRKSGAKRAAIIRIAITIINERSYELATMREIAAAVDLSDAALYYYFQSKQALAFAAHVHSLERFEATLDHAAASSGTGFERVSAFLKDFVEESYTAGPQLYFGEHSYLNAQQRWIIDDWAKRLTNTLEAMLCDGIADGSIVRSETRLVVQLLLGMLIWLAKWVPAIDGLSPERLLQAMDDVALRGLQAAPSTAG